MTESIDLNSWKAQAEYDLTAGRADHRLEIRSAQVLDLIERVRKTEAELEAFQFSRPRLLDDLEAAQRVVRAARDYVTEDHDSVGLDHLLEALDALDGTLVR